MFSTKIDANRFFAGLIFYVLSFILPALWNVDHFVPGWACAYLALAVPLGDTSGMVPRVRWGANLAFFGTMINALAITFVLLRLLRGGSFERKWLAIAILACLPPMWLSLYLLSTLPFVGHAVWILGLLLMIFDEIRPAFDSAGSRAETVPPVASVLVVPQPTFIEVSDIVAAHLLR